MHRRILGLLCVAQAVCAFALTVENTVVVLAEANRSFRSGDLAAARRGFDEVLRANPRSVGAHLGLGRLDRLEFRRAAAIEHLSAAFELAPEDPAVIREYAAVTPDPRLETALLRRLVRLERVPDGWLQEAKARLEIRSRLGGRPINRLLSPYDSYQLKMPVGHSSAGRPLGWILRTRINGSRPLRLMLDTGSRGILLNLADSASLHLEQVGAVALGGFGQGSGRQGRYLLAGRVQVENLEFANVIVEAADQRLPDLDGLIGLDLFRQFRIRLDGPHQTLALEPFAGVDPSEGEGERPWGMAQLEETSGASLLQAGHVLIAKGQIEGNGPAQFVLDSGAAYSLVHPRERQLSVRTVTLEGMSGITPAAQIVRPVRVRIGGFQGAMYEAMAVSLEGISDQYGLPIHAFAGFPVLRRLATTIDLRSGELFIDSTDRH